MNLGVELANMCIHVSKEVWLSLALAQDKGLESHLPFYPKYVQTVHPKRISYASTPSLLSPCQVLVILFVQYPRFKSEFMFSYP